VEQLTARESGGDTRRGRADRDGMIGRPKAADRSGDADRRHWSVGGIEHWSRDTDKAQGALLVLECHAVLSHLLELFAKPTGRGDRSSRTSLEGRRQHREPVLLIGPRQQRLADRRHVQGHPTPHA